MIAVMMTMPMILLVLMALVLILVDVVVTAVFIMLVGMNFLASFITFSGDLDGYLSGFTSVLSAQLTSSGPQSRATSPVCELGDLEYDFVICFM